VVTRGKTPVLSGSEMRQLLKSIDMGELIGRDRALLGLMGYTFARVTAVVSLRVEDYFSKAAGHGYGSMKKGANATRCPAIITLINILRRGTRPQASATIKRDRYSGASKRANKLTNDPMTRKRRALHDQKAGERSWPVVFHLLPYFSRDWITAHLQNGGTLEDAQQIAAHQSPRTTKLYDRTRDEISLDDVERIKF
jgi:integrase/recombinase XerD